MGLPFPQLTAQSPAVQRFRQTAVANLYAETGPNTTFEQILGDGFVLGPSAQDVASRAHR